MSNGNNISIGSIQQTASGDGAINQAGVNTATTNVHKGDRPVTVPEVFDAIRSIDLLPPEAEEQLFRPLQTLAELPPEELELPSTIEQAQPLINQLVPYAPAIGKGLAVFGSAALSALASSNPVISGIVAVCKLAT